MLTCHFIIRVTILSYSVLLVPVDLSHDNHTAPAALTHVGPTNDSVTLVFRYKP